MRKYIYIVLLLIPSLLQAFQTTKNLGGHSARKELNLNNESLVNVSSITFQDGTVITSTATLGGGGGVTDNSVYTNAIQDGAVTPVKTNSDIIKSSQNVIFNTGQFNSSLQTNSLLDIRGGITNGAAATIDFGAKGISNVSNVYSSGLYGTIIKGENYKIKDYIGTETGTLYAVPNKFRIVAEGSNMIELTSSYFDLFCSTINFRNARLVDISTTTVQTGAKVDGRDISVDGAKLDTLPTDILNSSNTYTAKPTINNDIEIGSSGNQKEIIVYDVDYSTQAWKVRIRNGLFEAIKAN